MLCAAGNQRPYADRDEAGTVLAGLLARLLTGDAGLAGLLVLGLPRGGVPVAGPVARRLGAPLDVLLVRKVGAPEQPELAMGAVAAIGARTAMVGNESVLRQCGVSPAEFAAAGRAQLDILRQQAIRYRGHRAPPELSGRPVVVVDDGLATGASVRVALTMLRTAGAGRLVVAVPTGPRQACQALATEVDALVCPWQPVNFGSVSQAYRNFAQISEASVIRILAEFG